MDTQKSATFEYKVRKNNYITFWLLPENLLLLQGWRRNGATLQEIADNIGIHYTTLMSWQRKSEKIKHALTCTKEITDLSVEGSLYKRTQGFEVYEREFTPLLDLSTGEIVKDSDGKPIMVLQKEKRKLVAPDVTACLAWLYNRKPSDWQNNRIPETDSKAILQASQVLVQIRKVVGVHKHC